MYIFPQCFIFPCITVIHGISVNVLILLPTNDPSRYCPTFVFLTIIWQFMSLFIVITCQNPDRHTETKTICTELIIVNVILFIGIPHSENTVTKECNEMKLTSNQDSNFLSVGHFCEGRPFQVIREGKCTPP